MSQIKRVPISSSVALGQGFNALSGEFVGTGVEVVEKVEQLATGGHADYGLEITESHTSFMSSLGLSMDASGRYGLAAADGKFELAQRAAFNTSSTYVVASCRVQNAMETVGKGRIVGEYRHFLEKKVEFEKAFGSHFARGIQTGGEFYVVLKVTSTDKQTQSSLSAEFHAECQGLAASGEFNASFQKANASQSSETKTTIISYQKAGRDGELSYVSNPTEIIQRMRDFSTIARHSPFGYEVEVAEYVTLPLPEINLQAIEDREFSLADCARLRLKYITVRNDIEFARENRLFFDDLPPNEELSQWYEMYTRALAKVQMHAQKIAGRLIDPVVFDLKAAEPGLILPLVNFRRVDQPSNIVVPAVTGKSVADAKRQLAGVGLVAESSSRPLDAPGGNPLQTILSQEPAPGSVVPPGTRIRIVYEFVKRDPPWPRRFPLDLTEPTPVLVTG